MANLSNNTNIEFDIDKAFTFGIALNRNCAKIIDDIYYKDETIYYEAYLKEGLHKDFLKTIFSMKVEDRINKLSGIIAVNRNKKDTIWVENIIKKVHPSIVSFVKKSNTIDIDVFLMKYKIHDLSEESQFSVGVSLIYLSSLLKKDVYGSGFMHFILGKWETYDDALAHYLFVQHQKLKGLEITDSKKVLEFITEQYSLLKQSKDNKINESLELFISEFLERCTYEKLGVKYENYLEEAKAKRITMEQYENARHSIFRKGMCSHIGSFSRYLKALGVESSDIFIDTTITNYDLDTIFRDCYYAIEQDDVKESEKELYIVACLYIFNLVTAYKQCKDLYLNKAIQDKHNEVLELERKIEQRKETFDNKINKYKEKNKELEIENKDLKQKIKELEKENARLAGLTNKSNSKIEKLENLLKDSEDFVQDLKEELSKVSEIAVTKEDDMSIEDKIEFINNYKIGLFGGLSSIKGLSKKLKNITFYESFNQDLSSIASLDAIFVSYEFFNHAFTKKLNSELKKYDVNRGYISGTNETLIINTIYNELIRFNQGKK